MARTANQKQKKQVVTTTEANKNELAQFRPVVGILMERSISHADKVFFNFLAIAQQGWPFIRMSYGRTDFTRNKMALQLLQSNFTHLIMLDIDHIHPVDIVQRLMANFVRHPNVQVVGGLNFRRGEPFDPCAFIKGDDGLYYPMFEWPDGLVQVDAVGTGSLAIAREVFELIPPPWFYNDYSQVMKDIWPGEDLGFAEACKKFGIKQYVDTTVTSPHLIDSVVERSSYEQFLRDKDYTGVTMEELGKADELEVYETRRRELPVKAK